MVSRLSEVKGFSKNPLSPTPPTKESTSRSLKASAADGSLQPAPLVGGEGTFLSSTQSQLGGVSNDTGVAARGIEGIGRLLAGSAQEVSDLEQDNPITDKENTKLVKGYSSVLPVRAPAPKVVVAGPTGGVGERSGRGKAGGYQSVLTTAPAQTTKPPSREAKGILELIGSTENGQDDVVGYNETLGDGAYTGGDITLTDKTLDEIEAIQGSMLRHPSNSLNSSALGKYQIVRTTMRSLRTELGLKGDELFSPAMQDRMANALLERRGLSDWKAGRISDNTFIDNLSKEWASLPTSKGVGYYGGQNSRTTPQAVLEALS